MNGLALPAFTAACLTALLAVELRPHSTTPDLPAPPRGLATPQAAPHPLDPAPASLADTILARPLFSQTRRLPNAASPIASTTSGTPLPRMTAILIDGPRRSAIFAPPNGRPAIVAEGGRIGPFTVETIEPGQVTIIGPDGRRTVRTSFDPTLQPPAAAQPFGLGAPLFPGIIPPGLPQPAGAAR